MDLQQANNILGHRANWELKKIQKALKSLPFFNTPEDNQRLEAVNIVLKANK